MTNAYDEDYFLRGQETGKSLYKDYRWLPELTKPMASVISDHCGIELTDKVLDFGCSRGYLVRALVEAGHDAYGMDVSDWAIANCDETIKGRLSIGHEPKDEYDWIISKDTLEHLLIYQVTETLYKFSQKARKGVFVVVPLSIGTSHEYVVPEYEKDITHVIRWPLWRWVTEIHNTFDEGWEICARHRIAGIKDNYAGWPRGNGFITLRRIAPR
jgi:cyclopropane fatty-acyl-phospholipid synthase-like methyltransferase